jgi:hypothetical protein
MASRTDGVAAGACDLALHETSLQDHHGLFEATADDFRKTSYDLTIRALLCALEQQCAALDAGVLVLCRISTQKIEDTIVVDLVHGNYDSVFGGRICGDRHVCD